MSQKDLKAVDFDRLMNLIVITIIKKRFLLPNKTYIVYVLYTPYKKRVYKITSEYDKFKFIKGDSIDKVEKWCIDNNHEYIKRRGKSNIWQE